MERIYRIELPRRAVAVRRRARRRCCGALTADIFGAAPARRARRAAGSARGLRVLAPVRPSKIVCVGLNYRDHAAETGKAAAGRAAHLHQAVDRRDRSGRSDPAAARRRPRRSRGRARRRHRPPRAPRAARAGVGVRARPHLRERRDGPRSAEEGLAVHARARASTRSRRSARASRRGSTASRAASRAG